MSRRYRFHQLDVFTSTPLRGNALAVVHEAQDLSESDMAAFARWTNLSETTFLLPPTQAGADYRVRIFTPGGELPFAGHPTLGSCQAWLLAGGRPRQEAEVVQECSIGLVRVRKEGSRLVFAAPPLRRSGPLEPEVLDRVCRGLGIEADQLLRHQWVDNGPNWAAVMLASASQVLDLKPDLAALGGLKLGVFAPQPPGADSHFEVRAFVPGLGVAEDPVTGSLNAGLAVWLIGAGLAPANYVAAQGTVIGRRGRVHITSDAGEIWVGGEVVTCIEGEFIL
jgi:PhzF family phenazine biosynthesis protein